MANVMLGYPNRIDAATLALGAWEATLPLNNLKDRKLGKVARTTSDANSATLFSADLGAPKSIRVIALVNHNLSLAARYRIRADDNADFGSPLLDTGWQDVWPVVYLPDDLEWEDDNWWTGKYTDEEKAGYTWTLVHVLAANLVARYWLVELDDTANPDNYVQIGRAFIGPALQPVVNMGYGVQIGFEPRAELGEALSGAEYFNRRDPYRVARFSLGAMSEGDAFARAFEINRRAGIDQEVLFVYDPDDTRQQLRRRFLGRLRQLSPIEHPYPNWHSTAFELKELLP